MVGAPDGVSVEPVGLLVHDLAVEEQGVRVLRVVDDVHGRLLGSGGGTVDADVLGDEVLLGVGPHALVRSHEASGPLALGALEVGLDGLAGVFDSMLAGGSLGRTLVRP